MELPFAKCPARLKQGTRETTAKRAKQVPCRRSGVLVATRYRQKKKTRKTAHLHLEFSSVRLWEAHVRDRVNFKRRTLRNKSARRASGEEQHKNAEAPAVGNMKSPGWLGKQR
jgi:hypothetical protein